MHRGRAVIGKTNIIHHQSLKPSNRWEIRLVSKLITTHFIFCTQVINCSILLWPCVKSILNFECARTINILVEYYLYHFRVIMWFTKTEIISTRTLSALNLSSLVFRCFFFSIMLFPKTRRECFTMEKYNKYSSERSAIEAYVHICGIVWNDNNNNNET